MIISDNSKKLCFTACTQNVIKSGQCSCISSTNSNLGNDFIQRVMYWRDIDKEMPPEHEKVLVLLPDDVQLMAQMNSNGGWGIYWADGQKPMDNDRPVLKWMPLPACT